MFLNVPGLVHQHLADASLPAGNTLEGLTDSASVSGPPLISIPSAVGPLINMSIVATQPTATGLGASQPAATQLTATPLLSTMLVRPDQMGYFTGTPSFYRSNQV